MKPNSLSPTRSILIVLLLWAICSQLWSALSWGHESFQLTEWLINYSGGFVRRGLPGSILAIVSDATGILPNHLIIGISFLCYGAITIWFLKRSDHTFPAILILSSVVMGFPAYQDSIIRKDCLCLLLFLACLKVSRSGMSPYFKVPATNLIAASAILSHEAFAFYALPALVVFGSSDPADTSIRRMVRRSLNLIPSALCVLIVTRFHGTPELAEAVNDSWIPFWRHIQPGNPDVGHSSAAIQALGWNSNEGMSLALYLLTSGLYQPLAWVGVFAISFLIFLLFTGRESERVSEPRARVAAMLITQLVFITPLFVLGVDYGRWLFIWLASTVIIETEKLAAPQWVKFTVARLFQISRFDILLARMPVRDWYLLLFGVPVCWTLFNFLTASPLGRHAHIIWSLLRSP